jgi:DNA gyrase inhibitor GyrI
MRKKWIMVGAIVVVALIGAVAMGPIMSDVEIPNYDIVETHDHIEIRQYKPMIIAEVQMQGQREEAIGEGFRLLADYIFGNNTVQKSIAMTAPVQQQENAKIAMTAPVQQQSTGNTWQVSFVMPSQYSMETLPKPNNDRVTLKEIPAKQFIVIRFSGMNSEHNVTEHEKKLMEFIQTKNIAVTGTAKYAFYNPPWTLPPMRRNEIMIELNL